jgi:FkbM family methyltransferase
VREGPLISYSQNGEDIRLWRVLSGVEDGFYVDVGAAHPSDGSVTRLFYDRGWSGVNVEPSPYFDRLAAERMRDVNLRVAVGAEDADDVRFFVTYPDLGMSTLDPRSFAHVPEAVEDVEEVVVPMHRLATILQEHAVGQTIHFMKVDVEGAEREVLASSDWEAFRPLILVVAVEAWSAQSTHEKWEPMMLEAGYVFAAFDGLNRFYVEGGHPELVGPLAYPLSALDVYVRGDVYAERVEVQQHVAKLEALLAGRERLKLKADAELGEMRRRLADADVQVAQLEAQVAQLREANATTEERARVHEVHLEQVYASRAWKAGRLLAGIGRPPLVVARGAKRRLLPQPRPGNPVGAYMEAVAAGGAWHFPLSELDESSRCEDGNLAELIDCLGEPARLLAAGSTNALACALASTNWTDGEVLLAQRFSWAERQAIVETDAVARLARDSKGSAGVWSLSASEPSGEVVVDVRCLQDPAYSARGVGGHGRMVVAAARAVAPRNRLVLLTSAELPPLPPGISGQMDEVLATPYGLRDRNVALFVELSPMTASVAAATPLLGRPECRSAAVVLDFIPTDYPAAYLRSSTNVLGNRLRVEALRRYDVLLPISKATEDACRRFLGDDVRAEVTGMADTLDDVPHGQPVIGSGYALIPGGDDPRKNIPAAIAAIALDGRRRWSRPLRAVVTGGLIPIQAEALCRLAEHAGLRPDMLELLGYVDAASLASLHTHAEVVVVASLAEGFSLPVAEAVRRGTPVVASDIPSHRELLGGGAHLAPPTDVVALAGAITYVRRKRRRVAKEQRKALGRVAEPVEVRSRIEQALGRLLHERRPHERRQIARGSRPRVAVVSPLPPQRSGVADYTAYTFQSVARYADVEAFTAARVSGRDALPTRPLSATPYLDRRFDRIVSVVGNSHFHFPILDFLATYGSATIAHDTRMVEAYLLDRGDTWTASFLSTESERVAVEGIRPLLDDLDRVPSTGYGMIAQQSSPLIVHGRRIADCIFCETGVRPEVVPFVPYNVPPTQSVRAGEIRAARTALGFAEATFHIATFGIVDCRTKGTDLIVGAASWLRHWGFPVHLHVVGDAPPFEQGALDSIVDALGIAADVTMHGRVSREELVQFLLGVDVAVHLRTSGLLSLSGAVADCVAFGVPTVTTRELIDELEAPEYLAPVTPRTSTLLVAEAVEKVLRLRRDDPDGIEAARRAYLEVRSVDAYARRLLDALGLPVK